MFVHIYLPPLSCITIMKYSRLLHLHFSSSYSTIGLLLVVYYLLLPRVMPANSKHKCCVEVLNSTPSHAYSKRSTEAMCGKVLGLDPNVSYHVCWSNCIKLKRRHKFDDVPKVVVPLSIHNNSDDINTQRAKKMRLGVEDLSLKNTRNACYIVVS